MLLSLTNVNKKVLSQSTLTMYNTYTVREISILTKDFFMENKLCQVTSEKKNFIKIKEMIILKENFITNSICKNKISIIIFN